jgi:hypothetical protein
VQSALRRHRPARRPGRSNGITEACAVWAMHMNSPLADVLIERRWSIDLICNWRESRDPAHRWELRCWLKPNIDTCGESHLPAGVAVARGSGQIEKRLRDPTVLPLSTSTPGVTPSPTGLRHPREIRRVAQAVFPEGVLCLSSRFALHPLCKQGKSSPQASTNSKRASINVSIF